jgi:hypothetical protein
MNSGLFLIHFEDPRIGLMGTDCIGICVPQAVQNLNPAFTTQPQEGHVLTLLPLVVFPVAGLALSSFRLPEQFSQKLLLAGFCVPQLGQIIERSCGLILAYRC